MAGDALGTAGIAILVINTVGTIAFCLSVGSRLPLAFPFGCHKRLGEPSEDSRIDIKTQKPSLGPLRAFLPIKINHEE